ncbi:MAG: S-layer homology domain-containing protein [Acidimicrobiia bacterium]|nr:S-layer homology domain-containing protein [Acidimicrobiia bacterium]
MQRLVRILVLATLLGGVVIPLGVAAQTTETTTTTTSTTTTTTIPPPILPHAEQFESLGWHDTWIDWRSSDERNTRLTRGYQEAGLLVNIPPNERRGTGPFWRFPEEVDEAWFRYRIRLDDFRPITSGKLPGLAGTPNFTARGCNPSTEEHPGWSARMLFQGAGTGGADTDQVPIGYYVYHLDQPGVCGEFMPWGTDALLDQDWWYCVEGRVKLNTPGANDGVLEGWLDNSHVFSRTGLAFRRAAEDWLDIRNFWLNVYFGGSTIPNDRDLTLRIDDLVVSDTGRVGCPDRFRDDDGNPHEPNIEWMFQNEYVYGCTVDNYCPSRALTRAQTAALLDRILELPATGDDFFADDDGHWAEGPLNRLAAEGILRGCGDSRVCPDDGVTRGQFAAILNRSFPIPASTTDHFSDDDGNIFEADINAVAALGITRGCHIPGHYCTWDPVYRDQAATLLARTVQWWRTTP